MSYMYYMVLNHFKHLIFFNFRRKEDTNVLPEGIYSGPYELVKMFRRTVFHAFVLVYMIDQFNKFWVEIISSYIHKIFILGTLTWAENWSAQAWIWERILKWAFHLDYMFSDMQHVKINIKSQKCVKRMKECVRVCEGVHRSVWKDTNKLLSCSTSF